MKATKDFRRTCLASVAALAAALAGCATPAVDNSDLFVTQVKPVLEYYCIECHTDQSKTKFGGLSLETGHSARTSGYHAPVIIPGNPDASLLYQVLRFGHEHPLAMPPAPDKISDEQFEAIRNWIAAGAHWPEGATAISLFPGNPMQTFHGFYAALGAAITLLLSGCTFAFRGHDEDSETAPGGLTALSPAAIAESNKGVSFERQIKPILENKCLACHSGQSAPWSFSLESRKLAFAPGASGPRIIRGKPDQSLIIAFASTHKNVAAMPLVGNRLTETESRILRRWIAEGAQWPAGKAGGLKPAADALRPERTPLREDWRFWFDKDKEQPKP